MSAWERNSENTFELPKPTSATATQNSQTGGLVGTSVKIAKQMAESVMMMPQMRTPSLLLIFWSTMPPVKQPIMRATKYTIVAEDAMAVNVSPVCSVRMRGACALMATSTPTCATMPRKHRSTMRSENSSLKQRPMVVVPASGAGSSILSNASST